LMWFPTTGVSLRKVGGCRLHNPVNRLGVVSSRTVTKILFVTYSGAFGGAERVLLDCAAGVAGPHTVACPPGGLADHAREAGLSVVELPERGLRVRGRARHRVKGPARLVAHAAEIRRLAADLDPDLVLAWGMRSGIAALALDRSRAFALAHHDFLPSRAIGAAVRLAAARAAVVTVNSKAVAEDLDGQIACREVGRRQDETRPITRHARRRPAPPGPRSRRRPRAGRRSAGVHRGARRRSA